jgi:hypothetical protein
MIGCNMFTLDDNTRFRTIRTIIPIKRLCASHVETNLDKGSEGSEGSESGGGNRVENRWLNRRTNRLRTRENPPDVPESAPAATLGVTPSGPTFATSLLDCVAVAFAGAPAGPSKGKGAAS